MNIENETWNVLEMRDNLRNVEFWSNCKARLQTLRSKFESLRMNDSE